MKGDVKVYKITISKLGRSKATVIAKTENFPDHDFLHEMVRKYLASSEIDFFVDEIAENRTTGKVVVGGYRPVGEFVIDQGVLK